MKPETEGAVKLSPYQTGTLVAVTLCLRRAAKTVWYIIKAKNNSRVARCVGAQPLEKAPEMRAHISMMRAALHSLLKQSKLMMCAVHVWGSSSLCNGPNERDHDDVKVGKGINSIKRMRVTVWVCLEFCKEKVPLCPSPMAVLSHFGPLRH